jgi:ABC-type multidrug transport system ATPase subunit
LGTVNITLANELQGRFDKAINGMSVRLKFSSSSGLIGQSGAGINIK